MGVRLSELTDAVEYFEEDVETDSLDFGRVEEEDGLVIARVAGT